MTQLFRRLLLSVALLTPSAAMAAPSLEQMAGQMIAVGFQGDDADDAAVENLRGEIAAGRLGGVMFLKVNVKSLDAVAEMNDAFRAAAPDLPPFITLDQEGGAVERLTEAVGFTEIPNAETVAAQNTPAEAQAIYARMAAAVADLGFTVNFGPVADINLNLNNQIIARYGRAFSQDPATVAEYDAAFIEAHHQAGLLTALKHFPGHGSSTADSHEGFVDITESWQEAELDPYRQLIGRDVVDMVMVGHLYHADYAEPGTQLPSSLSARWIDGVLREDLGFDGVVISDDLEMGAIRDHFSLNETVTTAVRAGMDVLLFSNTADYRPGLNQEILDILLAEAAEDPAFADRIEESYGRIVQLKQTIR
ncbi:glycoside hydrolase family 3 N-terminal domain-containing protein [Devosia sp. RR2S18]|uniref:glycoside hydrolase family 3 N-terminal domain-containing protein n=1 Tax=Devosia rhizosphaerae TaxID=3049774 RepID=UPI0025415889|nr:glycoside hydrolase family 3 N-terminal domain-containing protein [Devosia sp. RR2S18]WIJ26628.1 glycoside hydrolase family 3 N-terminal domain-containing protein [Devosia sp. RR2S18]